MKQRAMKNEKKKSISCEFVISPKNPIMFRETETCKGIKPDVFCYASFSFEPEIKITRLNTVVRLWSTKKDRAYRTKLDSDSLKPALGQLGWKRVMLRIHFDYLPKSELAAPAFHMQIGGRENHHSEYCWFPQDIDVPRILCLPVDIIGACELIMANFFPSKYFELSREGNWTKPIKWSEENIVQEEVLQLLKSVKSKSSMLRESMSDRR